MHTLSQWNLSNGLRQSWAFVGWCMIMLPFSAGSQYTPRIYRWLWSQGTKCWSRNVRWIHRVTWPMLACHCWASKLAGWNLGWALRQWIIALPELKCEGLGSMFLIFTLNRFCSISFCIDVRSCHSAVFLQPNFHPLAVAVLPQRRWMMWLRSAPNWWATFWMCGSYGWRLNRHCRLLAKVWLGITMQVCVIPQRSRCQ